MAEMQSNDGKIDYQCADEVMSEDLGGIDGALCNVEADEYFLNIKGELNQVDRLVSDAVNNLVINFRYISKLTKTHHEMVTAIERMAVPDDSRPILELLDRQMKIAEKIEQELEMAITSLQFGDLVTQLLAHTTHQVEMLNIELQRIDRKDNWRSDETALHTIHERISKAVNLAKTKGKRKPVVQQGMQMGDIELF